MLIQKMMPRKLRGFTLTEAAIVLGIVGLILGAIWVAASAVYTNLRVQSTTTQILQMAQSIRSLHATQQTIDSGVTAVILAQAGVVPNDMLDDPDAPTTVTNVWGNNVTVASANGGLEFDITYTGIPGEACTELLTRMTGPGRDGGLVQVIGGSTTVVSANFPVTVVQAVTACGTTASTTVAFRFRLRG